MPTFTYEVAINLSGGPKLSFSDHFHTEAYTKISALVPAGIVLSDLVPEYTEWVEPEPDLEDSVDEIAAWEDVPILLNEFNNTPTTVNVQPSDVENVNALVVDSDNYDDIYYTVDDGSDVFELTAPMLLIGSGCVGLLGNSSKNFTLYNLGSADANLTFLVARNALQ